MTLFKIVQGNITNSTTIGMISYWMKNARLMNHIMLVAMDSNTQN
jgi:hypothetical protein